MSRSSSPTTADAPVAREYLLGVRILEVEDPDDATPHYTFEAPDHVGSEFDSLDRAELYADVYFDVNGFAEAGTGERGVPPEIVAAGQDTLSAYFMTQPTADVNWVASFFGTRPDTVEKHVSWVRERAAEIRAGARERGME